MLVASLSTFIVYVLASASGSTEAVSLLVLEEVATFWRNKSIVDTPNFASVTFSTEALNELKIDLMVERVVCESWIFSFFSSSVVTLACLNLTSDSTHDDVSSPDANPLNDIVIFLYYSKRYGVIFAVSALIHCSIYTCKKDKTTVKTYTIFWYSYRHGILTK